MNRLHLVLRLFVSVGLLVGLAWWLEVGTLVSRLTALRPAWVLLAVAISLAQVAVLAWRWSFTARRLGVELSFVAAWREYYLSIFLNQVLPGGVLGDVTRAWRQARSQVDLQEPGGPAVRAVVFERLSAQAVMTSVAVVSVLVLPVTTTGPPSLRVVGGAVVLSVLLAAAAVVWTRRHASRGSLFGRVVWEVGQAHLSAPAFAAQLVSGILVVSTYLATYVVAARAVGVDTPVPVLLPLVAPVLMSMLIPVTVAGWGLREGTAALLWGAVGLTAADGVVVSVAYGLLVFLSSLPGAVVLLTGAVRRRSRTPVDPEAHPQTGPGPSFP